MSITKTFTATQTINGNAIATVKHKDGTKGAAVLNKDGTPKGIVPWDICSFAAGKDAWMREILFKCNDCGTKAPAKELEGDCLCFTCYEKAGEEIAKMDGRG